MAVDPYSTISETYREKVIRRQRQFQKEYRRIFEKVADDFANIVNYPSIRFYKSFQFPRVIDDRINLILKDFHDDALDLTEQQIKDMWALSNSKNDEMVKFFLRGISGIKAAQKAAYLLPNTDALSAFLSSPRGTESLSDLVWKVAKEVRFEMTTHLGIGIANGDSAQVISRRIRQYLDNPLALFRRVRDENGNLVASEAMKAYHPGQGVYRSAYKNAMRLARTETNRAYHRADNKRWKQIDFVLGFRIKLSASHPEYSFPEICEVLEGDYPKDFVWDSWHPCCLCHRVPIMSSSENFMAYLEGKEELETIPINEFPGNFREFASDNFERFMNYRQPPYWFQDNRQVIEGLISGNIKKTVVK